MAGPGKSAGGPTARPPVVRQLLVERVEQRLPDAHDLRHLAVRWPVAVDLGQAPQPHRVGRHQLVFALVNEEAQAQIPVQQLKVGAVQLAVRMVIKILLGRLWTHR